MLIVDDAGAAPRWRSAARRERARVHAVLDGRRARRGSGTLVGLAFCVRAQRVPAYVPLGHAYLAVAAPQLHVGARAERLAPAVRDTALAKVCADSKREIDGARALRRRTLRGVRFDSMLASYLIDPERHGHSLRERRALRARASRSGDAE